MTCEIDTREAAAALVTVVGQGLAGSWLAWRLEQAGWDFVIYDPGTGDAASRVAAGLVNPITGRRWVPTWGYAEWGEEVAADYDAVGAILGKEVRRALPLRRRWRDPGERAWWETRRNQPNRARWWGEADEHGVAIRGAWQVEVGPLLEAWRRHWLAQGRLQERRFTWAEAASAPGPVIWTVGSGLVAVWPEAPWQGAAGEVLGGDLTGEVPREGLLDREWVLPRPGGGWWVGATYRPEDWDTAPTAAGREHLLAACRRLTGRELRVGTQRSGVRVSVPDKRPVAGWWPGHTGRQGVMGALGSKGVLWAPRLARCWVEHLQTGRPLPAETDVSRLFPG